MIERFLSVNTIEFNGEKAVINSYAYEAAFLSMNKQRQEWEGHYPNATVRTERMTEAEAVALVAHGDSFRPADYPGCYSHSRAVGESSK